MNSANQQTNKPFLQAAIAFVIFCALSFLGRFWYPIFGLATLMGIALPLAWGKITGKWAEMGFTRHNMKSALLWSIAGGILTSIIGITVLPERVIPAYLGLQLAIGIPIWVLIASPFQEFFFRGWLQTRFEHRLGNWWGLVLTTVYFTLWHYCAPFVGATPVPLETPVGALPIFAAGLVYAYVFQRTRNIVAPWLAHVLTGIAFIVVSAMDFTQPVM